MYKLAVIITLTISTATFVLVVIEHINQTPIIIQCRYPQQTDAIDYPVTIEDWTDWPAI